MPSALFGLLLSFLARKSKDTFSLENILSTLLAHHDSIIILLIRLYVNCLNILLNDYRSTYLKCLYLSKTQKIDESDRI